MKWIFGAILATALIASYLIFGSGAASRVGADGIEGDYFAIIHPVPTRRSG